MSERIVLDIKGDGADIPTHLVEMAVKAMDNAYVPYSRFHVGAALLCEDGTVYTGCNIENASYGPTNCAERTAIFTAINEGRRDFKAIAIVGGPGGKMGGTCPPCGVCRQVLSEFCGPDFIIYLGNVDGYEEHTLGELLPLSFSL